MFSLQASRHVLLSICGILFFGLTAVGTSNLYQNEFSLLLTTAFLLPGLILTIMSFGLVFLEVDADESHVFSPENMTLYRRWFLMGVSLLFLLGSLGMVLVAWLGMGYGGSVDPARSSSINQILLALLPLAPMGLSVLCFVSGFLSQSDG